jgi:hypothetical protein
VRPVTATKILVAKTDEGQWHLALLHDDREPDHHFVWERAAIAVILTVVYNWPAPAALAAATVEPGTTVDLRTELPPPPRQH